MKHSILAAILALASFGACAQQTFGNIVVDVEAGDTVSLYSPDVGLRRERMMEKAGQARFPRLPLGLYVVTITRPDGTSTESSLRLRAGQTIQPRGGMGAAPDDGPEAGNRNDDKPRNTNPAQNRPTGRT